MPKNLFSIKINDLTYAEIRQISNVFGIANGTKIEKRMEKLVNVFTTLGVQAAQSVVPIHTGELRDAIHGNPNAGHGLGIVYIDDNIHESSFPPKPEIPFGGRKSSKISSTSGSWPLTNAGLGEYLNVASPWSRSMDSVIAKRRFFSYKLPSGTTHQNWISKAFDAYHNERHMDISRVLNG